MKTKTLIVFTLLAVLLVSTMACGEGGKQEPTPTPTPTPAATLTPTGVETATYTNTEYGFSIEYPRHWDVEEGPMGFVVSFWGPSEVEGDYIININLVVAESPTRLTAEDVARLADMELKRQWPSYAVEQEYSTTINGEPAVVRIATVVDAYPGITVKDMQVYFAKGKTAYVVTCDATEDTYAKYQDCFETAVQSFKLR